ncbi:MAG: glycosyltransferase [Desulfobacterales bacterium]|nr:glycosyltransferase [Desulfobacterales bacterium]
MNVLHIYKDYDPPVKGGIEGHINILANGLKEKGIQVKILISNIRPNLEKAMINDIPVIKVPELGRVSSAPLNPNFPYWLRKLGQNADLLHFHFPNPTGELSFLFSGLKKKTVVTYHSDIVRQTVLEKFYYPFMNNFLIKADKIISTSPHYICSSKILSKFKAKCEVIPLGIDLAEYNSNTCVNLPVEFAGTKRGKPFIILFIGKFRYYKGVHVLIKAMKDLEEARLLLIGTGPMEKHLRRSVSEFQVNKNVRFLGEVSDTEKIKHLHACDVLVLPSIYRSEAFGIVLLEAMACGKPIITTEIGTGTSFINQHKKTGLIVKPNCSLSLSKAIQFLMHNPDVKSSYGKAGQIRANNFFSKKTMINRTLKLYEKIQTSNDEIII